MAVAARKPHRWALLGYLSKYHPDQVGLELEQMRMTTTRLSAEPHDTPRPYPQLTAAQKARVLREVAQYFALDNRIALVALKEGAGPPDAGDAMTPPAPQQHDRYRFCSRLLPAWLPVAKRPNRAMLLHHLGDRHPAEIGPYLERVHTEDIAETAAEAFEVVEREEDGI